MSIDKPGFEEEPQGIEGDFSWVEPALAGKGEYGKKLATIAKVLWAEIERDTIYFSAKLVRLIENLDGHMKARGVAQDQRELLLADLRRLQAERTEPPKPKEEVAPGPKIEPTDSFMP